MMDPAVVVCVSLWFTERKSRAGDSESAQWERKK